MKNMLITVAALLICVAPATAATSQSGLAGNVQKACPGGYACSAAPMRATLVFTRHGLSYVVRSGSDGAYRVMLGPGKYRVSMVPRIGITAPRIRPGIVTVRAGRVDRLDFSISFELP
jgi:hypothetical protein